jgi:hypothetical protein
LLDVARPTADGLRRRRTGTPARACPRRLRARRERAPRRTCGGSALGRARRPPRDGIGSPTTVGRSRSCLRPRVGFVR